MRWNLLAQPVSLPLLLLASIACSPPPTAHDVALELNPNPSAPLAATLTLRTDRPAVVSLAIDDGESVTTVTPDSRLDTEHELLVLGLLPATRHTITVTLSDRRGRTTSLEPIPLETEPLPADFPPISVPLRRPHLMEPGYTLIPVFRWTEVPGEDDKEWGLVFAADAEGRVRWFFRINDTIGEVRRMRNGNLFFIGGRSGRMFEIDMLGNVVASWHSRLVRGEYIAEGSTQVDTDTLHHDVIELGNGNFAGLSTEARRYEDYPSEYPPGTGRKPTDVIGDVLVEFTRSGEVVRRHRMLDILDPYRLGRGSLSTGFYEEEYEEVLESPGTDWAHSNAIIYLEESDAVVVSSNMQSVHYKVDWTSGELEWLLGDPTGWREPWSDLLLEPEGELTWPYHHHGIEPTPHGTWLLFDNGGARSIPPNPEQPLGERYSRVVELAIDEEAGTVREAWSYGPEQEWFMSPFISDADWLPQTGNVLITDGGRFVGADGEQLRTFGGRNWARVIEVTHGESTEKIWELIIDDPARGYSIYRAQRLASLYPSLDRPTG